MERRKPKNERKESGILIRVTADEKALLEKGAKRTGLGVSAWLRSLGLQAAGAKPPGTK